MGEIEMEPEEQTELFDEAEVEDDTEDAVDEIAEEEPAVPEPTMEVVEEEETLEAAPEPEPELPSTTEILRYQVEQLQRSSEHWRQQHDQLTGKLGPQLDTLRRENAALRGGQAQQEYADEPGVPRSYNSPEVDDLRRQVEELRGHVTQSAPERAKQILADETTKLQQRFPQLSSMQQELVPHVQKNAARIQQAMETGDENAIRTAFSAVMGDAFMAVVSERSKNAQERQGKQVAELRKKKKLISPVGGAASEPSQGPKDPEEMSDKELDAYLKKHGHRGF